MGGAKKRPIYKIVVADSRFPRDGRFIEKLGFFNPLLPKNKKERIGIEEKRVKHWLSKGAQPTIRVARILGELGMMSMPVQGNNPQKAIPKKDRKKETKTEAPKTEAPKTEAPKTEAKKAAPKTEAKTEAKTATPKTAAPKTEAKKAAPKTEAKKEKTKK